MPKKEDNDVSVLSLEELIEKLNQILNKLEDEELPLEEAVELFASGAELNKIAREKLSEIENRIKLIKKGLASEYSEENFQQEDDE
ncbi:exodeoxyribonuclease VII small subunit [bacterium]|nr:exodeoxyribonuclease VII small subunit [bacterium]